MAKPTITFDSDIDDLIKNFRGRITNSVLNASSKFAQNAREVVTNTYDFENPRLMENYVTIRFFPSSDEALVKVINKKFSLIRLKNKPPMGSEPGYTRIWYHKGRTAKPKMFPVQFSNGGMIMVTRSNIQYMTEDWQPRQSSMPFTSDTLFDSLVYREKESVFQTYERKLPRTHTFRIPRTLSTVDLVQSKMSTLTQQLTSDVSYEISEVRQIWKKKKKPSSL